MSNPLADKRADWEKFPKRWAMCDGGFVYYPGGARHDELPEDVRKEFRAVPQQQPKEKVEETTQEAARKIIDARGLIDVRL
jgi:hypothetical protein